MKDLLEDWKRTYYSTGITPQIQGEKVTIFGWVTSIRKQGGIVFIVIRDKEGEAQVTIKKDKASPSIREKLEILKEHSSIGVMGVVKSTTKTVGGAEIIPSELKILSDVNKSPPFNIFGGQLPGIDKRLDIRAVDLRRPHAQRVFKVREIVTKTMREYFHNHGYFEINTPKIISSATEGGASLFPILYYDREAFLTQSPQLYKEQLIMPFEKVFEIAPAFRAEQSRTLSHLSEFISIDVEEAYVGYRGIMETLEEMMKEVLKKLVESSNTQIRDLNLKLQNRTNKFKVYSYEEALNIIRRKDGKIDWGDDISVPCLEILNEDNQGFYFIIDWPSSSKPFYIKPHTDRDEISESFDLMYGSTEIVSGGTRVDTGELLVKRLKAQNLKPKAFEYHIKIFDYGMPPHSGFGLGLERLLMALTGIKNVREVSFFPRDMRRLTP